MAFDLDNYIEKKIGLELGAPLLPLIEGETNLLASAKEVCLGDFYLAFPYIYRSFVAVTSSPKTLYEITFQSILEAAFPTTAIRNKAYYIGPVRIDYSPTVNGIRDINEYLLAGSGYIGRHRNPMSVDYLQSLTAATFEDQYIGTVGHTIDPVLQKVILTLPSSFGSITIDHGIGFDTTDYIPVDKANIFAKMIALEFLRSVRATRSSAIIQADFTIDIKFLDARLTELEAQVTKEKSLHSVTSIIWD